MKHLGVVLTGYRFGPFEADLRSGELRKHGLKIRLQEQPFQVLVALMQAGGNVVSREDLRQKLWPADTFVDFDHGLNAAMARLREALCDSAEKSRYVETIPRRGYRFLAAVQTVAEENPRAGKIMLAVLPFKNLATETVHEYFADGMTEEMIAQLGRLSPSKLGVIARTSAMRYKHTEKTIGEIGRELQVDYLLEGSVRRAGQRVRITAQLVQVSDQTHLWAESYDRTLDDILAIQTDCAGRIAQSLAVELLPSQREAMHRSATYDAAAYEAYLQGRYYWNRRTEAGFQKAISFLERAIQHDASYAHAYVGLSDVFNVLGLFSALPPQEAFEKARAAASKALALDPSMAEAHTSMGYAVFLHEWDWKRAEEGFQLGLRLNPNYAVGHYWYALFLAAMGRFDEALAHIDEARALDPLSLVVHSHHGWILYFARRYTEAVEQFNKALELDGNFLLANTFLGLTYIQLGEPRKAQEPLLRGIRSSEAHPGPAGALAVALARCGKRAEARRLLEQIVTASKRRYVSPFYLALASLGLGEPDQALDWLEKAYKERSGWLVNLKVEPAMDPLRSHPRFRELMQRMVLPA